MEPSNFKKVYQEFANVIGTDNAIKVYDYFKGQQVVFPRKLYSQDYIVQNIKKKYKEGTSIRQLAKMYDYSDRRIRQIINKN